MDSAGWRTDWLKLRLYKARIGLSNLHPKRFLHVLLIDNQQHSRFTPLNSLERSQLKRHCVGIKCRTSKRLKSQCTIFASPRCDLDRLFLQRRFDLKFLLK